MSLDRPKIVLFSHPFLIQPPTDLFDPGGHILSALQQIVDRLIPETLWQEKQLNHHPQALLDLLDNYIPIFQCADAKEQSRSLAISYLGPEAYTESTRRYLIETLSRRLFPGKPLEIVGGLSLYIRFAHAPTKRFFLAQDFLSVRSKEEKSAILRNLPDLLWQIKKTLPNEFLSRIEHQVHPIFMPRNEEETIRNLIILGNQIQYVRDLPQVSIHYEKQTDSALIFTVLVVRLLKKRTEPLRKALEKNRLRMDIDDVRILGSLKQKYPKEAALLRISIPKRPFFRPDYSLDLLRARQEIGSNLLACLGKFRDFNGGMIRKQEEALNQLRKEMGALSQQQELLLENYFYSLQPVIMQTVHETHILKRHFEQLNQVLQADFKLQPYQIFSESFSDALLCFVAATSGSYKEKISEAIASLEIGSRHLSVAFLEMERTAAMGFILHATTSEAMEVFHRALAKAFYDWSRHFYCLIG